MNHKHIATAFVLASALMLAAPVGVVHAQSNPVSVDPIKSTPKGTIGLGLVGAELGLIIPSAAGLTDVWALTVFPVVGAAGGALAGYFALDEPGREKGSVAALVVGLAGVVPAVLVTVNGVRRERQQRLEPAPRIDLRTEKEQRAFELVEAGSGLLRKTRSGFRASMPGISVAPRPAIDAETARFGGLRERTEMKLSLASGVF